MEIASKKDAIGTRRRVNLDSKPACWIITCPYPSERWVIYGLTSVVLLLGAVSKRLSCFGENVETMRGSEALLLLRSPSIVRELRGKR